MTVDNIAILFLGKKTVDIELEKIIDKDILKDVYFDDVQEYIYYEEPFGLKFQFDNGYITTNEFIGFEISSTRSYDYEVLNTNSTIRIIEEKTKKFFDVFGVVPNLILIEYQC